MRRALGADEQVSADEQVRPAALAATHEAQRFGQDAPPAGDGHAQQLVPAIVGLYLLAGTYLSHCLNSHEVILAIHAHIRAATVIHKADAGIQGHVACAAPRVGLKGEQAPVQSLKHFGTTAHGDLCSGALDLQKQTRVEAVSAATDESVQDLEAAAELQQPADDRVAPRVLAPLLHVPMHRDDVAVVDPDVRGVVHHDLAGRHAAASEEAAAKLGVLNLDQVGPSADRGSFLIDFPLQDGPAPPEPRAPPSNSGGSCHGRSGRDERALGQRPRLQRFGPAAVMAPCASSAAEGGDTAGGPAHRRATGGGVDMRRNEGRGRGKRHAEVLS
mmetsp:Transcript_104280/g.299888  ORF Transcript_104280/g.299888 Transcript_104280/m.299888 type:complete len:330 (+) Transcript_104280:134-1123(+)